MHIYKSILCIALALTAVSVNAQYPKDNPANDKFRTSGFPKLKNLKMTAIPGAPVLSQPQRVDGSEMEIRTGKHGLCYPAVYDWNGDGLPDLLLGEFSTGDKENNIKVYLNSGTRKKPKFTGKYFYATDMNGDTISNKQWCCIGIHPRFVDINGDGHTDILSGEYNPGRVALWKGSGKGFSPLEYVEQEGYKEPPYRGVDHTTPESNLYWNYTTTGFADYDGDGLLDLFVGGNAGLRVALNEGTKDNPKFGLRQYLRYTDGSILTTDDGEEMWEGKQPNSMKTYMTPVDWDQDGVLDLLVTYEYEKKGHSPILFYRGARTNLGLRFHRPVSLFEASDGSKALPGCQPMITVADINGDGVNDIIMGISIPTITSKENPMSPERVVADSIAWQWIYDMGIQMPGKDAGEYYMFTTFDQLVKRVEGDKNGEWRYYLGKLTDMKYLTMRHQGYVLVFYGKKNAVKATAEEPLTLEAPAPKPTSAFADANVEEPLSYRMECLKHTNSSWQLNIFLKFKDGWHGFADKPATADQGMIPTKVEVITPEGIMRNGKMSDPYIGDGTMYFGEVKFVQYLFQNKRGTGPWHLKIKVSYQSCNDSMCMPPVEHIIDYEIQ